MSEELQMWRAVPWRRGWWVPCVDPVMRTQITDLKHKSNVLCHEIWVWPWSRKNPKTHVPKANSTVCTYMSGGGSRWEEKEKCQVAAELPLLHSSLKTFFFFRYQPLATPDMQYTLTNLDLHSVLNICLCLGSVMTSPQFAPVNAGLGSVSSFHSHIVWSFLSVP